MKNKIRYTINIYKVKEKKTEQKKQFMNRNDTFKVRKKVKKSNGETLMARGKIAKTLECARLVAITPNKSGMQVIMRPIIRL
jgi:hypothetical protein